LGGNLKKSAENNLQVEINLPESSPIRTTIFDNQGVLFANKVREGSQGFQTVLFDDLSLHSGIYTIQVQTNFGNRQLRFIHY
jgi:hypothetical protein